ncbi:MAG: RHS repeat protein, partial [Gammaproteobacteria bacterium]|nr:RHS repeat protein [Gammaproteobacteria bacterium]
DAQGRLEAVEDKRGNRLEYTYSSTRQPLVGTSPYGVDPTKPITVALIWQLQTMRERLAEGTLSGNQVTLSYSATTGRLQSATDQSGRSVTYTHDELADGQGNMLTAGNLIQVDGPEGVISSYQYNDTNDNHNLTGIQEDSQAEWVINTYTEDRVTQQTYGNETTTFEYVADYIETKATVTVTDENGANPVSAVDHFCFDDLGYVSEHEDAEDYLTINTRDSDYRVTRKERWSRASDDADIRCNTTTDTVNRTMVNATDNSYDSDGRLLTETVRRGDGRTLTTTRTYDGSWVASKEVVSSDEPARIFRTEYTFFYDGNGKPNNIKTVTQKRDAGQGGDQTTTYAYNSRGQTVSITYADNTSINLDYGNGSLYPTRLYFKGATGETLSDLATINTYDTRGNLATVTDAAAKKTILAYDARNRLIKVTNPLGE